MDFFKFNLRFNQKVGFSCRAEKILAPPSVIEIFSSDLAGQLLIKTSEKGQSLKKKDFFLGPKLSSFKKSA